MERGRSNNELDIRTYNQNTVSAAKLPVPRVAC